MLIGDVVMDPANSFYAGVADAWATCRRLQNVHFLGPKPFRDVSTYLEHMDVNTICYRLDAGAWTRAAYPFKIHECLAVGRPVVCAAMPEVQRRHADVIDFATMPEDWDAAIARALGPAASARRRNAKRSQHRIPPTSAPTSSRTGSASSPPRRRRGPPSRISPPP